MTDQPISERLREARNRYGHTQEQAAHVIGCASGAVVSQWERGAKLPTGLYREAVERYCAENQGVARWPDG